MAQRKTKKVSPNERRALKILILNAFVGIILVISRLPIGVGSFLFGLSLGLSSRIK